MVIKFRVLFGAHSAQQSVSYKVRQQSHHLITISLNIIKLIIITTLMLEMRLAFRSIGVSTKDAFQSMALSWPKKIPSPPLDRCAPQPSFPNRLCLPVWPLLLTNIFYLAG